MNDRPTLPWRIGIAILIALPLFFIIWLTSQFKNPPQLNELAFIWFGIIYVTYEVVIWTQRIAFRRKKKLRNGRPDLASLAVSMVAGCLAYVVLFYGFRWIDHLFYHSPKPQLFSIAFSALIGLCLSVIFALIQFAISLRHARLQAELRAEQYKSEMAEANLSVLRNQLDPHFLFNNFNTLSYLMESDLDTARTFLKSMAEVYRHLLKSSDKKKIAAAEEFDIALQFLAVLKQRLRDALVIQTDVNRDHLSGFSVPPLVMQQLLENMIKHNQVDVEHPLKVEISLVDNRLQFKNNRHPKKEVESIGVGLENIRKRYAFLTDRKLEVEAGNTHFVVSIPLLAHEH